MAASSSRISSAAKAATLDAHADQVRRAVSSKGGGHALGHASLLDGNNADFNFGMLGHEAGGDILIGVDPLLLIVRGPELDHNPVAGRRRDLDLDGLNHRNLDLDGPLHGDLDGHGDCLWLASSQQAHQ
jgi:hypothetical protein